MIRCRTCLMPETRPDTQFTDGECSACISYRKRATIDWGAREKRLLDLLDQHHGDCIVASSGGKDSHWIALKLLEIGAHPIAVTATTCMLTDIGRKNIDNLARYVPTIEVTPNRTVRAKLNRMGLVLVGDISWPEHVSIFTTPFRMAQALGRHLIFYGENPQEAYGGPDGADAAFELTPRWRSEFGGFLGLRPPDLVGKEGITYGDMSEYMFPAQCDAKAYFLGQFYPWDSHRNAITATEHGMLSKLPTPANWWIWENLDNAMTGLHDYMMFRKYGYGRGCAQISVDVRSRRAGRLFAEGWVKLHDGLPPDIYMDIPLDAVLDRIGMKKYELDEVLNRFTNLECSPTA